MVIRESIELATSDLRATARMLIMYDRAEIPIWERYRAIRFSNSSCTLGEKAVG